MCSDNIPPMGLLNCNDLLPQRPNFTFPVVEKNGKKYFDMGNNNLWDVEDAREQLRIAALEKGVVIVYKH